MTPATYTVGDATFDARSGELRSGAATVRLSPLPARALAELLARPGEVVTRQHLMDVLWPGERFGLSDRLTYCIHQLREALDAAGIADVIETLPRRGYRYLPVVAGMPPSSAPDRDPASVPRRDRDGGVRVRRTPWLLAAGIGVALIGGGLLAWPALAPRDAVAQQRRHADDHAAAHGARHTPTASRSLPPAP